MSLGHAKKQPMIWRELLERPATQRRSKRPRIPGVSEGTFEIMLDFFEMPDDSIEFFGGREEDASHPHLGGSRLVDRLT